MRAGAAFDAAAGSYDREFTDTALGRRLRASVWAELDGAFPVGDRVLELGCGTGEDAIHLASRGVAVVATDTSERMLEAARAKAAAAGADDLLTFGRLDLSSADLSTRVTDLADGQAFDGAFSDFGALNVLADRRGLARALGSVVRPGGCLILVVMGPFCPWEVAWHVSHRQPRAAVRRWRSGAVASIGVGSRMRVWYPSPTTLRTEFAAWFESVASRGLGIALPPSGLAGLVEYRPGLLGILSLLEQRLAHGLGRAPMSAWAADHYMQVLRRVPR